MSTSSSPTIKPSTWASTTPRSLPSSRSTPATPSAFPNTWSHFLNQMQPGVPVETLAKIRVSNPGKGPHSIIGPIYVNGAEPGDVLEVRYKRILPFNWGAVFNNPGSLGTGLLPQDFPDGQVKYLNLDLPKMTAEFVQGHSRSAQAVSGDARSGPARRILSASESRRHQLRSSRPHAAIQT